MPTLEPPSGRPKLRLGYSKASKPSAVAIADASEGRIIAIRTGPCDVNWGRRRSSSAKLNGDTSAAVNKRVMRELFRDAEVPMPTLFDYSGGEDATAGTLVLPVLGRPDFHTRGNGFWKCETYNDIRKAARGAGRKKAATHFMEWLDPEQYPVEWRVHIFQGKSIRMSVKVHTGFHEYTTAKPGEELVRKPARRAAKAAVAAVGLDFGAVDILTGADGRNPKVLEVNCAPGLGGSMPKLWADTFLNWYEGREM